MALGHRSVAECQHHVSSREFMEWTVFDEFEPIGSRTTPDLLALLVSLTANVYRKEGARTWLPQDILADPLLPPRLTAEQEEQRKGAIIADYRRLRAERLANMEAMKDEG